ncbi:NAD-dependent epimerase/dehydratase family protein [Candidatus Pelagibacter ubique]|nr:NAD-dependent epimerase/dehydratase family protein [Candidatus Pelagibacter ubique]
MKPIIITGGGGYIGSAIASNLLKKKFLPIILDRSLKKKKYIFPTYKININKIGKVLKKYNSDIIIHCASSNHSIKKNSNIKKYYEKNIIDLIKMLFEISKIKKKFKIIFASSCSVYGKNEKKIKINEKNIIEPYNVYGSIKLINEEIIKSFASIFNYKYVILRLFNVSGVSTNFKLSDIKALPSNGIITKLIKKNKKNNIDISFFKNPKITPIRDFVHIDDVAEAFYKSIVYINKNKNKNNLFNIGSGSDGITLKDLIQNIEKIKEFKIKFNYKKSSNESFYVVANTNKAKQILNFNPKNSSIKKIINSFLNKNYES